MNVKRQFILREGYILLSQSALLLKVPLQSEVGAGVFSDSQVEVLWRPVALQAAVGLPPTDSSGQGLPLLKALAPASTLLQAGHDLLCQILLESLEVLSETETRGQCWTTDVKYMQENAKYPNY